MRVAIGVPYRNREEHLKIFVPHMRNYLPEADIKVVEQCDEKPFNRGKLLNIFYLENKGYDYYILHDVDLIVETADYSFPRRPTHIATELEQFDWKMPFPEYFGGVNIFTGQQFEFVNGFTNLIYGWGLEDSVLRRDFHWQGIKIDRRKGRFKSLPHERPSDYNSAEYKANEKLLRNGRPKQDGLKFCQYELLERTDYGDYELIKVLL